MPYGVDSRPEGGVASPPPKHEDGGRVGLVPTAAEKAERNPPRATGAIVPPAPVDFSREPITHPQRAPVDYGIDVDQRLGELEAQAAILNNQIAQLRGIQAQATAPARPGVGMTKTGWEFAPDKENADGGPVREHSPVDGGREGQAVFPDRARAPEDEAGAGPDDGESVPPDRAGSAEGGLRPGSDDERRLEAGGSWPPPDSSLEGAAGDTGPGRPGEAGQEQQDGREGTERQDETRGGR